MHVYMIFKMITFQTFFYLSLKQISLSFKKTEISSLTSYAMYLCKIHIKLIFLIKSYEILFTFKNYVCMYLASLILY